eukprot:PhM_4_TR17261/c0_g1_i1/m.40111/K16465/CETN1; centrin-1
MASIDIRVSDTDIDAAFELFDTDGSGYVDHEELQFALKSLGYPNFTKADVVALMKHVDPQGKGTIDKEGFRQLVREKTKTADSESEILAAFKMFDMNKAGKISYANLYDIAATVTSDEPNEELLRDVIKAADRDGDGEIGWEDWKYAMAWVNRKHGDISSVNRWMHFGCTSSPRTNRRRSVADEKVTQLLNQAKAYDQAAAAVAAPVAATAMPAAPKMIAIAGTSVMVESDGHILKSSAWSAVSSLNEDMLEGDFNMMFAEEDTDDDGKLTVTQYKNLLMELGEEC